MTITIIGMGLIGGSLCKAIKAKTPYTCYGVNRNPAVLEAALRDKAIDKGFSLADKLPVSDVYIVCFHPKAAIDYIESKSKEFAPGSLILDVCGVKSKIVQSAEKALFPCNVRFLGTHPMAGREFSGYDYSLPTLYDGASIVLTPTNQSCQEDVDLVKKLADNLGFGRVVVTTPEEHDRIIAFTSQMAHVVANAYVKTPMLERHGGFTGGSFQDMTRVARLNADMWTELFLMNRGPLLDEINNIILHLGEYRDALANEDETRLHDLLQDGSDRKIQSLEPEDH
jgi:prephenate dehydrogenase